jgi:hypothetical protein
LILIFFKKKKQKLCEYIDFFYCVCVERKESYRSKSTRERKGKTEHRQLLSKPKQRSILNESTKKNKTHHKQQSPHTHTHLYRPMWNEKEKTTTDKHTEANYNSRMKKTMYNTRKEKRTS